MTAKEKADDLIKKMLGKNPNRQDGISKIDFIQAKLCAIVVVDEILNEYWSHDTNRRDWYQEVKQEINKL